MMAKPKRSAAKKSSATARKSAATRAATPAPTRHDPRLKKIYVYSEGTFVLHNASSFRASLIEVLASFRVNPSFVITPKCTSSSSRRPHSTLPAGST
jgi:hypothetical protein